jgi:hypothetical protein
VPHLSVPGFLGAVCINMPRRRGGINPETVREGGGGELSSFSPTPEPHEVSRLSNFKLSTHYELCSPRLFVAELVDRHRGEASSALSTVLAIHGRPSSYNSNTFNVWKSKSIAGFKLARVMFTRQRESLSLIRLCRLP